jgi:transposase
MISSGSRLATDIRYAVGYWTGLTRFLEDGRLELDTNPVENAIRPVALTRRMHCSQGTRSAPRTGLSSPRSSPPAS